jgi:hypothetical protein
MGQSLSARNPLALMNERKNGRPPPPSPKHRFDYAFVPEMITSMPLAEVTG